MFMLRREVYLDNNATTKVTKDVVKKISYILKHYFGNPSSLYKIARDSAVVLEESRIQVAKTINATPDEIYFTGSATEANNNILKSLTDIFRNNKKKIISTPIEHPSVMSTLEYLKNQGVAIEYMSIDEKGLVLINKLEEMIDSGTFLICCMLANNEIGTIQDIKKVVEIAKRKNVFVFSDCVQALGKIKVDVRELGIDYASFSAHKIHGPKGIGAIFVSKKSPFSPLIHGGHQEFGMRAGTESLHNIAGFAEACKGVDKTLIKANMILSLKQDFISELKNIKKDIIINSPDDHCLPNTISVTFRGINNAVLMAALDYYGISVSAGSACNTQSNEPSHVLKAIGLSDEQARETIRFSFSDNTTSKDIQYTLKIIKNIIENKLPSISMLNPKHFNENILFDEKTYILDVRFWYDRKVLRGLPNSHEISFIFFNKYINEIPKDKNVIVICQVGLNSPIVAYYLRQNGIKNVSFLMTGLVGWRVCHPDMYDKYAGNNITKIHL